MSTNLDLSVPSAPSPAPRGSRLAVLLLVLVLALQGALLYRQSRRPAAATPAEGGLPAEASRTLALKLEKQGLTEAAAQTWQAYLRTGVADPAEIARVWYRVGCLNQDGGQFEQALAAFYRSEAHATEQDFAADLGRRVQECLEALGKFAALRYELAERVGIQPAAKDVGDIVLAEIGPRRITKAEVDRRIEEMIENRLAQMAGQLPPEQLAKQKESLVDRLGNPSERQRFLEQYVIEQMLYLKAREDKLPEDPGVRARLLEAERGILADEAHRRVMADRIQITPGDVETFYEANKASFVVPARARIRHILLPDEEQAKAAINSLKAGKDFAELARTASQDQGTAPKGGLLPELEAGAPAVPGIGPSPELAKAVFAAPAGEVLPVPYQSARGWHVVKVDERVPEKQTPFEEAREDAYSRLLSRKQQEVQQALFEELRRRYDVVIHRSQVAPPQPESAPAP